MFKKHTFSNGLRLVLAPVKGAKSLTVLVLVGTGSKYETKEINGLSHFLEHMFFKGTKKRPSALEVASSLDEVGGSYNAFTSQEFTGYWAKVDAKHSELALDWVSDIFLNSKLDEAEIAREKGVIIEEINMYQDTPVSNVWNVWSRLLYGDQPAGWLVTGEKETVKALKREDFLEYMKNQYVAKNTIVVLAGNLEKLASPKLQVQRFFKNIRTGNFKNKPKVFEKQNRPAVKLSFKETDQSHFILGFRGYDIFNDKRYAASLLATILGGYMSSRLFIEVRERRGLCYYIRALNETFTDSGYLVANAGVDNGRVAEAIKVILEEFKKISDEVVPEGELKKAKDHIKGATLLSLESSDEVASFLGTQEILKREILTPEQFFSKIEKITSVDLSRVAKELFQPKNLNLALIGPFKDKRKFEKLLKI